MGKHLNYFSDAELVSIKKFEDWRTKILQPVSRILVKIGITPNMISAIGLFMLAGFVFYIGRNPLYSVYFLALHVVLDAFDGSLARYMKEDSNAGALTDMMCDHTGMFIVTTTLVYQGLVNGSIAIIYVYLYTMMIIFMVTLNRFNIPLRFAIRTKYYLYILFALWAIWGIDYFNAAIAIFTLLMILPTAIGFMKLHRYFRHN